MGVLNHGGGTILAVQLKEGKFLYKGGAFSRAEEGAQGREKTLSYGILQAHNASGCMDELRIRFDGMASHDITYVGIILTARASGMKRFPLPYVLTNCHNSLCAVGGTINEDDHLFGLSAAKKYGGVFVPPHQAVIHQYVREKMAGGGKMILGSDSHTRYGALGTMGIGEGGPELVKQLCEKTYDISYPGVVAVHLKGRPQRGVGPQDVALAIIKAVFEPGFVKNKVMEFIGPAISELSVEFRSGIDVMTTETTCLSSIWETDEKVLDWYKAYGSEESYKELKAQDGALYDGLIQVDLSSVEPMIALPFHPSNAYPIREFKERAKELLQGVEKEASAMIKGKEPPSLTAKLGEMGFQVDQGVIGGCSGGTYENLLFAANLLKGGSIGSGAFSLSVYPASQPQHIQLMKSGAATELALAGATLRSAFCGPCFGAGDTPANGGFSIRHNTRNFPSREGAKPGEGQLAYVALMDARSIAATALNGGILTAANELELPEEPDYAYEYDDAAYASRVYDGWGRPDESVELQFGPNIADWPSQIALPENYVLKVASAIYDPVTTTDELIPSGETSSYRSNPIRLSMFALSRKDPDYVPAALEAQKAESSRREGTPNAEAQKLLGLAGLAAENTGIGSLVFALKPGDGSAREQAASCQRVLGGCANIAGDYATKRYRSNVVNWGMLPFILKDAARSGIARGDVVAIKGIRKALIEGKTDKIPATLIKESGEREEIALSLPDLSPGESEILLAGCLINYYGQ
ncbi:MAG: hydratase [Christensenellaceae bacterium]|nr:hydratase [Christensenellaceae bacterium]